MLPHDDYAGNLSHVDTARDASRSGVQSLDIALRILDVLVRAGRPLSLREFSTRCRMSSSKLHRYLHSFVSAGMMTQYRRAGDYDLGNFALQVGLAAFHRVDLLNNVAEGLPELALETGTPALLAVWSDQGPTIIRLHKGPHPINATFSVGSVLPLLSSATGRVFLAYLPTSTTAPILAQEVTETAGVEDSKLIVSEVQKQGVAITRGSLVSGWTGISAPIFNVHQEILGAVTIMSRTDPATEEKLIGLLKAFTAGSARFGQLIKGFDQQLLKHSQLTVGLFFV